MNYTQTAAQFPGNIPERVGPCRLKKFLGSGGMGTVFLAEMAEERSYAPLGGRVAVKVMRPDLNQNDVQMKRFQREASLGIRVRHPAVVQTYEVGAASFNALEYPFLVMEFVEGRTLGTLIAEMGVIPEALLRQIAAQVARSLEVLHSFDAIHRDIKPDNILITPDHQVKLMDFGVALSNDEMMLTGTGFFVGTIKYAAPEQFEGGNVGPPADLYALGVSLYEAATGARPFDAPTFNEILRRQLHEVPSKAGIRNPLLTVFFEELVAQLLEKDPRKRFPSAGVLAEVLETCESSEWWKERERALRAQPLGRIRRIRTPRRTTMVGRNTEMNLLWDLYQDARTGSGKLVLIEGETGVGKTRLVDAFLDRLEAEDVHVLHGSNHPGVLSQSVVDFFGQASLEGSLVRYLRVQSRLIPSFAALLTGSPPPVDLGHLSAEAVHAIFCQLAKSLALERPAVWVLEDLHAASPGERAILLSMARIAYDYKILLIATSKSALPADEMAEFERLEVTRRVSLPRLNHEDVTRMVLENFGFKTQAAHLASRVAFASDGNPFFAVEILRELKKSGHLKESPDGSYEARGQVESIALPSSIRELLRARLDVLGPEDRALLEVGAVQGFKFDPDLVARVLERKRLEVLQRLAGMERHSGIVRAAGAAFQFDHPQLQELLYGSLPAMLRAEYHGLLASSFEQRGGLTKCDPAGLPGEGAVFLARNYLKGGLRPEGMRFLDRALDYLEARYGNESLLELADLAIEQLGADEPALRCDIRLRQAACLTWLGNWEAQRTAVEDALNAAESSWDEARIVRAKCAEGRRLVGLGQYNAAREALEDALSRAHALSEGPQANLETETEALSALGQLSTVSGRFDRARDYYERLLQLARQMGDRRMEARALADLGVPLVIGDPERGRGYLQQHLAIAREIGFRYPDVFYGLSLSAYAMGRYDEANRALGQYLTLCRETGRRHGEALAYLNLGRVALDEGRLDQAGRELEQCREAAHAIEGRHLQAFASIFQADLFWAREEVEQARSAYEEAVALCRSLGVPSLFAQADVSLGRLLLFLGDRHAARPLFVEAAELTRHIPLVYSPGPLPAAYLALLGEVDPSTVIVPDAATVVLRAETHLVLYWAGAGGEHLEKASALLHEISRHLTGEGRESFWIYSPAARLLKFGKPASV